MYKLLSSITFIFLSFNITFSQTDAEKEKKLVIESLDLFFSQITKLNNIEAYKQLSLKAQKRKSVTDFDLKFKKMFQYYGKLNSFDIPKLNEVSTRNEHAMTFCTLTFEKTQLQSRILLLKDSTNKFKIDSYYFSNVDNTQVPEFNEMAKIPLNLLINKDYKNLYKSAKYNFLLSYEDHLNSINTLIKTDIIKYELNSYDIDVRNGVVNYKLKYNINNEGDIIFTYEEEKGIIELQHIDFYLRNKVERERNVEFQKYLDTLFTPAQFDTLSFIDSLDVVHDFDKLYRKKLRKKSDEKIDKLRKESQKDLLSLENQLNDLRENLDSNTTSTTPNFTYREGYIIGIIDQFKTKQENEQLGRDVFSYDYIKELQKNRPSISSSELQGITYEHFTKDSNKEISFRLFLSKDALLIKEDLIAFFTKSVNSHIEEHLNYDKALNKAIKLAETNLDYIKDNKLDLLWNNTSESLRETITKNDLINALTPLIESLDSNDERILMNRQYHKSIEGLIGTDFFVFNFNSQNKPKKIQQIIFQLDNKKLKIVGFHIYGN